MRTDLTDDELAFYRDNGFLVIDDFLDADEIDELEAAVAEVVADAKGAFASAESNLVHLMDPFQRYPRIRKFSTDPRLARFTADLEGIDAVRLYQDMVAVKEPWGGPTGWHMDVPRISFTADHAVSYWFPMVDVTLSNACLYYLPGVHREKRADAKGAYAMDQLAQIDPAWTRIEPMAAPVRRGGVVLHEGYAPHGTNGNMSARPRTAFVVTHMPDGAVFDGTPNLVQPGDMPVGAPLDDETRFPLVFTR
jgi:ectoine hydroxylase-related dioxygenase (phytanoyl-CoA dioxygenase family)